MFYQTLLYNTPADTETEDELIDILDNTDLTDKEWEELNSTFDIPGPPTSTPIAVASGTTDNEEAEEPSEISENPKEDNKGCTCSCAGCERRETVTPLPEGAVFQIRSLSSLNADKVRRIGARHLKS